MDAFEVAKENLSHRLEAVRCSGRISREAVLGRIQPSVALHFLLRPVGGHLVDGKDYLKQLQAIGNLKIVPRLVCEHPGLKVAEGYVQDKLDNHLYHHDHGVVLGIDTALDSHGEESCGVEEVEDRQHEEACEVGQPELAAGPVTGKAIRYGYSI